jgi:hypothetical protein
MALKRALAGAEVPEPDRLVIASRRKKLAVGRKRQGPDAATVSSLQKKFNYIACFTGTDFYQYQVQRLLVVESTAMSY